jgi:hypothetical protein
MTNENQENIDRLRLELDQRRIDQDRDLKLKELELQKTQSLKPQWATPVFVALLGGGIGLVGNFYNNQQALKVEQEKQKGTIVIEAIKTGDPTAAAKNLVFLSNAKLINLSKEQKANLVEIAGKNPIPALPQAGTTASAIDTEAAAFNAIIEGKLEEARILFGKAYAAYPTLHNVDEIFRKVLTQDRVDNYSSADTAKKAEIQKQIAEEILKTYSWGLTDDTKAKLRSIAQTR